jgi:hypothetical protein
MRYRPQNKMKTTVGACIEVASAANSTTATTNLCGLLHLLPLMLDNHS